jgi:sulfate/thiosulfate-binding protein
MKKFIAFFVAAILCILPVASLAAPLSLLNVSYDPTRELYEAYNPLFVKYWKDKTGQDITVTQSHGGSGKQARAVIDGLKADVVTLALAYDIDEIAERSKLIPANWQSQFPHNSAPYTSAIVFLVKKGNPKHIKDWDDLIKGDVKVVTPNPKTSGGARWNYMAAWGYALKKNNGSEEAAKNFITQLFLHVPVLDTGARGATTSFVERGMGDVLIAWENDALLITQKMHPGQYEIILPSISIEAEPPVAVVEKNAEKKGATQVAKAYLDYLYSKEAQKIIAENYCRPSDKEVLAQHTSLFPTLPLQTIQDFGGWEAAQKKHFSDGGLFDQIYTK